MEKKYDIFISYSRKDLYIVRPFIDELEAHDFKLWLDLSEIDYGDTFPDKIAEALDASDSILFMCTPNSLAAPYCKKEIGYARTNGKEIRAILVNGIMPKKGWFALDYQDVNCINITKDEQKRKFFEDIESAYQPEKAAERARKIEEAKAAARRKVHEEEIKRIQEAEQRAREEELARIRRKEAEEKVRKEEEAIAQKEQNNKSNAKVHLCVDADSRVYYSNKEIARCIANKEVVFQLPIGQQTLKIVSIEDNSVKKQLSVNINSSNFTIDEIKIAPIIKRKKTIARKHKEEEERRRRDEQFRREQAAIKAQEEQLRKEDANRRALEEEKQRTRRIKEAEKERDRELAKQERKEKIASFKRNFGLIDTSDVFFMITFFRVLLMFVGGTIYWFCTMEEEDTWYGVISTMIFASVIMGGLDLLITGALDERPIWLKVLYQIFAIGFVLMGMGVFG